MIDDFVLKLLDRLVINACGDLTDNTYRLKLAESLVATDTALDVADVLKDDTKSKKLLTDTWNLANSHNKSPSFLLLYAAYIISTSTLTIRERPKVDTLEEIAEDIFRRPKLPKTWPMGKPYKDYTDEWSVVRWYSV